jgi:hypothetical protein
MSEGELLFHKIAAEIPGAIESKMFGALCIKAQNGKAGVMFWKEDMIFKLPPDFEKEILTLEGAKPFDPMGGRPMGGWVQLSNEQSDKWRYYAGVAMEFVSKIEKVEKVKKKKI